MKWSGDPVFVLPPGRTFQSCRGGVSEPSRLRRVGGVRGVFQGPGERLVTVESLEAEDEFLFRIVAGFRTLVDQEACALLQLQNLFSKR